MIARAPRLLEQVCPAPSWAVRHSIETAATPQELFAALPAVTGARVAQLVEQGGAPWRAALIAKVIGLDRPLFAQVLHHGFVVLTTDPLREVVVGRLIAARRPLRGRMEWDSAGRAIRVAVGITVQPVGSATVLGAEVRATGLGALHQLLKPLEPVALAAIGHFLRLLCGQAHRDPQGTNGS